MTAQPATLNVKIKDVKPNPSNPRVIKDDKFRKLVASLREFPEMVNVRPIVCNADMIVLGGNMRLKAMQDAGWKEVPAIIVDWSEEKQKEFIIKDNVGYGEWDWEMLANDFDIDTLTNWGLDVPDFSKMDKEAQVVEAHQRLTDTFIVPPFSVLDTRQGYWNERKADWKLLIKDNGESREDTLAVKGSMMSEINNGVSILDPVLAEVVNRWFGLPDCKTFDCFAGDTVFGYVSSYLGNHFTGIELRQEQADLNNERVKGLNAKYICDDGQNVGNHLAENSQDLLFSCPPYFDLEVYSDLPNDASNQGEYADFLKILDNAFTSALKCLKNNRFAVITVGDVRDKRGFYYRFVDDVKDIFKRNGVLLYNELVLVETLGTLPQRVARIMEHRKIGKCHQNVLVFYKGDPKQIKKTFPKLEITYEENDTNEVQL